MMFVAARALYKIQTGIQIYELKTKTKLETHWSCENISHKNVVSDTNQKTLV